MNLRKSGNRLEQKTYSICWLMQVNAMSSEKMSTERKNLAKRRAMVVTYITMYSQSQKANLVPSHTFPDPSAISN